MVNDELRPSALPTPSELITAGPGLVRLGAGVTWRVGAWAANTAIGATSRVVQAAINGESVVSLLGEAVESGRRQARALLGMGPQDRLVPFLPAPGVTIEEDARDELRRRGQALLTQSADVTYHEDAHPAYERILGDLAPDEARILRMICRDGPQPSVDVRGGSMVGSELVAPGLSMIGAHAGVRYVPRVNAYLNNLYRLGLIWFSREPVQDLIRYQVLEAQPEVAEALASSRHGRTVRRSIHLTPFGKDFCVTCFADPTDSDEA